jgi:hypothetical protein
LALQLLIAYRLYQKPEIIKDSIKINLYRFIKDYNQNKTTDRLLDDIQVSSMCCGVKGPEDYPLDKYPGMLPASCCEKSSNITSSLTCPRSEARQEGCLEKLVETFSENFNVLKYVAIFVVVFQALSILISCCLANNIRRAYDVV